MSREVQAWLGDPDDAAEAARLRLVRLFLLAYGALRGWTWLALAGSERLPFWPGLAAAVVQSVALALALRRGTAWLAPRVALPAVLAQIALAFPQTANLAYLEALAVALLCVVRRDEPASEALAVRALRGLAAVVLLQSGLQKLLYGHWLHGDLLAYEIGRRDPLGDAFRFLVSADERARLAGLDPHLDGAGPFRVDAPLLVAVSNGVWIAEIVLAAGLVARRARAAAAALAVALVLALQLAEREIAFGVLLAALLALFLPLPERLRRPATAPDSGDGPKRKTRPAHATAQVGAGRRRLVAATLAAVALWPLAHRALVARYGINPWTYAGWAEDATPLVPELAVLFEAKGKGLAVLDERTLAGPARAALERFRERRTAYGDLATADDLARAVFESRPDLGWLLVATQRLRLDPATARMTSQRAQMIYERAELMKP